MTRRYVLVAVVAVVLLLCVAGIYTFLEATPSSGCPPFLPRKVTKTQLSPSTHGAITAYPLPKPLRWANAIAVAPDGSVWFGEQAVPALAHLYGENGTLVEYTLPGTYPKSPGQGYSCSDKTHIWGVALWGGRVWATDSALNRLVGLSPANDSFNVVQLATNGSEPYSLTPGPDGALWFTQVRSGEIGTLFSNGTVVEHIVQVPEYIGGSPIPVEVRGVPAQIAFVSGSLGYYVDSSPLINGSALFAFDPAHFDPKQVGGESVSLSGPTSLSLGGGGVWLAQHSDSSLAFYDLQGGGWTIYPTSSVPYIRATLPYFVQADGSLVWFNEHYGNRMAVLNESSRSLTEYSISDPPAQNMSQVTNALTFAEAGGRAWFTESTGNAVGFATASFEPGFSVAPQNASVSLRPGESGTVTARVSGRSSASLEVSAGWDGPASGANVTLHASPSQLGPTGGSVTISVDVGPGTAPGRYTVIVTASDGLVSRSTYVDLLVVG